MEKVDPKSTKKYLENQVQRNKDNITDLRTDYDGLTDWVSQLHHKLHNHIREYQKNKTFFEKHRDAISILLGAAVLLILIALSGLKICGVI